MIATKFDEFLAGKRAFVALFKPTDNTSLAGYAWTKNRLVLNVMQDVKNQLSVLTPGEGDWATYALAGAPTIGTVAVAAVDSDTSDAVWITATDYLTPNTLAIADVSTKAAPEVLKSNPQFFDDRSTSSSSTATSEGRHARPVLPRARKDAKRDGSTPTLLYGYGGFEVSMTPAYSGSVGKGWPEKGGAYAVANIRGGGEYGPRWHQPR